MPLPIDIDKAAPADADNPSAGAASIRDLKDFLESVWGLTDATNYTVAPFSITTAGVVTVAVAGMKIQDGTAAAPSIVFSGATTTGLFRDTTNTGIGFSVAGAQEAFLSATAFGPSTSDGLALGTSSLMWADAFFATGAVLNFNNGNYTITHGAGYLNFSTLTFINDTANANMTIGLTINQGANDDTAIALKSSDVAHGMTDIAETDTYGFLLKNSALGGGLAIHGLTDIDGDAGLAIRIVGSLGEAADTTKSTAGIGVVEVLGRIKSGTSTGGLAADGNILSVSNSGTTRFLLDGDGDSHQDVGTAWTNFDPWDDIALLDSLAISVARLGDPLREQFVAHLEERRAVLEALPGKRIVTFNPDGHHFVNMSRLAMLHTGAIRQLARRLERLERRRLTERN